MWIEKLKLRSIRVYESAVAEFPDGVSVLFGPNGAGKTTILEAVGFLATLRSFRTALSAPMIRVGLPGAEMEGNFEEPAANLKIELSTKGRALFRDGKAEPKVLRFLGDFRAVALAPEHQTILSGSAEERRRFLDRLLFALDPSYLELSLRYGRARKQKQALLRLGEPYRLYRDRVAPWNDEMAHLGEEIRERRVRLVEALGPKVSEKHRSMAPRGETLDISYACPRQAMLVAFEEMGYAEYAAKRVLVGPHRDDLDLRLNGAPAEKVASQGERATALLALKLAEIGTIEERTGLRPILLLDDLGATLDRKRREKLLRLMAQRPYQALLTTADEEIFEAAKKVGARPLVKKIEHIAEGFSIARWGSK